MRRLPRVVRAPWLLLLSLTEPLLFRANVRLLIRFIRRAAPDVVLGCNGGYPAARATLAMVVAAHQCGVPAALSVVSMPTPRRKGIALYDKSVDAKVWRSVQLVIVNAQAIADALLVQHEMPRSLARAIYNGLPDVPYRREPKSTWSIGFVARLDRAKGVMVLLDAFSELAPKWPQLRLRLVGQGDASAALAERARELGINSRVEASGYTDGDINAILASFRVYTFPSFHEGLPYSILEAMRAGCTIVSSSVGGIPEILRDGLEGVLVPARDAGALAKAIDRLLSDEEASSRLGHAARARFQQNYLIDNFALEAVRAFVDFGLLSERPAVANG